MYNIEIQDKNILLSVSQWLNQQKSSTVKIQILEQTQTQASEHHGEMMQTETLGQTVSGFLLRLSPQIQQTPAENQHSFYNLDEFLTHCQRGSVQQTHLEKRVYVATEAGFMVWN